MKFLSKIVISLIFSIGISSIAIAQPYGLRDSFGDFYSHEWWCDNNPGYWNSVYPDYPCIVVPEDEYEHEHYHHRHHRDHEDHRNHDKHRDSR